MNPILAGQIRHVLTAVGGIVTGGAVAAGDSIEAAIGGIVICLISHLWSWLAKRSA